MSERIQSALKEITFFSDLPGELIAELANEVKVETLSPGELVFREGDKGDSLYFIQSGELEIYRGGEGGGKVVLATLGAGEYFGEMAILDDKPRNASVRTLRDSELFYLAQDDFNDLLEASPSLKEKLDETITARQRLSQEAGVPLPAGSGLEEGNTRVFISYSRKDKNFVQKLHDAIKEHGVDAWVDWENIPMTADWWEEIQLGITSADAFAFVISPDSVASRVCWDEIQTAVETNKRLVPILFRDTDPGPPMHEKISAHNWVWMRTDDELGNNLPEMLKILNTDLGWVRQHTRLLERAKEWQGASRNNSFLLRGTDLINAESWLRGAEQVEDPKPVELQEEYIRTSRREANRSRQLLVAGVAAFLLIAFLAVLAFIQSREADIQRVQAIEQAEIAGTARADAEIYAKEADVQRVTAQADRDLAAIARADAEANEAEAKAQKDEAERQRELAEQNEAEADAQRTTAEINQDISRSAQLSAQALNFLGEKRELTLLLSLEGLRVLKGSIDSKNGDGLLGQEELRDLEERVVESKFEPLSSLLAGLLADKEVKNLIPDRILEGHTAGVTSVAIRKDGLIASGDKDYWIRFWYPDCEDRVNTGEVVLTLAFSPDGKTLASAGTDSFIKLWDVSDPCQVTRIGNPLAGHADWVQSVSFSPDGKVLASASDDYYIRLWDLSDSSNARKLGSPLRGHKYPVAAVAFSPDGKTLASATCGEKDENGKCKQGEIRLWDVASGQQLGDPLEGHSDVIFGVAFSPGGKIMASGGQDKNIILWGVASRKQLGDPLSGHADTVTKFAFSPAGRTLASVGKDGRVVLWDMITREKVFTATRHTGVVWAVAFLPDPDLGQLVTASEDKTVISWNVEFSLGLGQPLTRGDNSLTSLAFSPDGVTLAMGDSGGNVAQWDLEGDPPEEIFSFAGYRDPVSALAFGMKGPLLTSVAAGGEICGWDNLRTSDSPACQTIESPGENLSGGLYKLVSSQDGPRMAYLDSDGVVKVWDLDGGASLLSSISPEDDDGNRVDVTALALSKDGRGLATASCTTRDEADGCLEGQIQIWDAATGDEDGEPFVIRDDEIYAIAFDPLDENRLASGGLDRTVSLWDIQRGLRIGQPIPGHFAPVESLAFSPDGRTLASGDTNGVLFLWEVSEESWKNLACQSAGHSLTQDEWDRYFPETEPNQLCP